MSNRCHRRKMYSANSNASAMHTRIPHRSFIRAFYHKLRSMSNTDQTP